jgi:hypothetical protein
VRFTTQAPRHVVRQAFRVALALTLTASPAAAQFTAVVAPPKARAATSDAAARTTPGARSDSAGRTALSDMRAWVDSAAGVIVPDTTTRADTARRDSIAALPSAAAQVTPTPPPAARDLGSGERAPDTATMLPFIGMLGLGMLAAGAWLLRRERAVQRS